MATVCLCGGGVLFCVICAPAHGAASLSVKLSIRQPRDSFASDGAERYG